MSEKPIWEGDAALSAEEPKATKDEKLLAELAALDLMSYGKRRKDAAKAIGIPVAMLDQLVAGRRPPPTPIADETAEKFGWTVEPWDEPVDTPELLADLARFFAKHVVLPKGAASGISLWITHAWTHDSSEISPLLTFTSPEMRCGKTTALKAVMALLPRPLPASNITAAAIFRSIEAWHPSLVIDEADSFMGESEELRGVINSGHGRDTAFVVRVVDTNNELVPMRFSTWCPKAIATIGKLRPTLMDRSIVIEMQRKRPGDKVAKLRRTDPAIAGLRRKLSRWGADHAAALAGVEPALPETLNDRAADNWQHLVAIADLAGGPWPEQARQAAALLSGGDTADVESTRGQLLADIRDLFVSKMTDRLSSEDIVTHLVGMEGRPWPEWGKTGKPISKNQLARQLAHFSIEPRTIKMPDGRTPKGYHLNLFAEAFDRYLPTGADTPSKPQPRHSPHEISTSSVNGNATANGQLRFENSQKPASIQQGGAVAVQKGDPAARHGFAVDQNEIDDTAEVAI